jgi:hypothetical protein
MSCLRINLPSLSMRGLKLGNCQKRPTIETKETYYRNKSDLRFNLLSLSMRGLQLGNLLCATIGGATRYN